MSVSTAPGFKLYDGIPVAEMASGNLAILGHYDKVTAFAALERHARESRGWSDLYCGLPPAHSMFDDVECHMALILDSCLEHGTAGNDACLMCDLVGSDDLALWLVDEFHPGAFSVMVWVP